MTWAGITQEANRSRVSNVPSFRPFGTLLTLPEGCESLWVQPSVDFSLGGRTRTCSYGTKRTGPTLSVNRVAGGSLPTYQWNL